MPESAKTITRSIALQLFFCIHCCFFFPAAATAVIPAAGENQAAPDTLAEAEIAIDSLGVPHIFGETAESAAFGLGVMHARDRYFQMEMMVRKVRGEMSALTGMAGMESDCFWVAYDFESRSKEILENYRLNYPATYRQLIAYSAGVNYYVSQWTPENLPAEYKALQLQPGPWQPYYCILVHKLMCHVLTYDDTDAERQELLDHLPSGLRRSLFDSPVRNEDYTVGDTVFSFPGFPGDSTGYYRRMQEYRTPVISPEKELIKLTGSNAWVVSGRKNGNGELFLANDTHMPLQMPGFWYEAELSGGTLHSSGFTLPGVPFVLIGNNGTIGWGVTNAQWDMVDRFSLQINPANADEYLSASGWQKFITVSKRIGIKGRTDSLVQYRFTQEGLLLDRRRAGQALLWYPAGNDASLAGFCALQEAGNWPQFLQALEPYAYPAQNFFYADTAGHIGYKAAGKLPVRPAGFQGGVQPLEKWRPTRFVPYRNLPQSFDPAGGYLSSANAEPAKTTYYIHYDWAEKARSKRITSMLKEKQQTLTSTRELQLDLLDLNAGSLKQLLKKSDTTKLNKEERMIHRELQQWNGLTSIDSKAPLYYQYFKYSLRENAYKHLDARYHISWLPKFENLMAEYLASDTVSWYDRTPVHVSLIIKDAIDTALFYLKTDYGKKTYKDITYGDYKKRELRHASGLASGTCTIQPAGNENSVNVNVKSFGPSMRMILVLSKRGIQAYSVIAGGQSGSPGEQHYADQFPDWHAGNYHLLQRYASADHLQRPAARMSIRTAIRTGN